MPDTVPATGSVSDRRPRVTRGRTGCWLAQVNKRFQEFQVQASYVGGKTLGTYDGNTQNEGRV